MPSSGVKTRSPARRSAAHELLASLTVEQVRAVTHSGGPLLLFAGPGAGKTLTITRRIAHLLLAGLAQASEILALTFTVRAAGEMRLRLADMLGEQAATSLAVCTFHALGARILRECAELAGRTPSYTIYDSGDVARVIRGLIEDERRSEIQSALARCGEPQVERIRVEISRAKDRLLTPETYAARSTYIGAPLVQALWGALEEELVLSDAVDLDDLLCLPARLLARHPDLRERYRGRFRFLVVDEFQDTNHAQLELVRLIAGERGELVVVGDDDQSLYSWRGAEPENILRFHSPFPEHRALVLAQNFRSRAEIVRAALSAVSHNERRAQKALVATRGAGGQVHVVGFEGALEEAVWVSDQVACALAAGLAPKDVMVLARTASLTRALQSELQAMGIPYRVLGERGLFERSEVRDALSYIALLINPRDGAALARAGAYLQGVGESTLAALLAFARATNGDLISACANAHEIPAIRRGQARAVLREFGSELEQIRREVIPHRSLSSVLSATLQMRQGIARVFERRRDRSAQSAARDDAERVLEDLRSLVSAASAYEQQDPQPTLRGFLEHALLLQSEELTGADERFTLSTIHRSKGAEAQVVFLLGCEDGRLPHHRALENCDPRALEEERRAFYVACTRARDVLVITVCAERDGRASEGASRFLVQAGLLSGSGGAPT